MAWRKCPRCDRWLATSEYDFDQSGETICPVHMIAVHGYKNDHAPEMRQVNPPREVYRRAKEELRNAYGSDGSDGGGWREHTDEEWDDAMWERVQEETVFDVEL